MATLRVSPLLLIIVLGTACLTGCGVVFINRGSKNNAYADYIRDPKIETKQSLPDINLKVSNFNDGTKFMNPALYGAGLGYWRVVATEGNIPNNNFIAPGGAEGGVTKAAHISGYLADKGDASYPTLALEGRFRQSGYHYDLSPFKGVRFYYKSNDKAGRRKFEFGIASTVPTAEGGVCVDQCNNHFGVTLPPSADWSSKSYLFSELAREEGWGATLESSDFADHLKEVVFIKWESGTSNVAGNYLIDFWVDKVEFY